MVLWEVQENHRNPDSSNSLSACLAASLLPSIPFCFSSKLSSIILLGYLLHPFTSFPLSLQGSHSSYSFSFFFFSSFSSLLLPINFSPPAPFANTMTTRKLLWAGTRKRTGQDKGLGIKQERRTPFCGKLLRKQTCLFQLILS